jgi:alpha-ketoglutarate-dependent taurine dioxygenase
MDVTKTTELKLRKLTASIGAEVLDVERKRLLSEQGLPEAIMRALGEHGVLVFRDLHVDDDEQVAFGRRLGTTDRNVTEISARPENPTSDYLRGTVEWHMDGTTRGLTPDKATILTAKATALEGGETEFASSYAAYEALSDEEKARCATLRVIHSFAQSQRSTHPVPTPEQLSDWESKGRFEYPLVWTHDTGRRSLVIGSSSESVVGMDPTDGMLLLEDLLERATSPDLVYRHKWLVDDMLIWDNPGVLHRVCPFDRCSGREMHRVSIRGHEEVV